MLRFRVLVVEDEPEQRQIVRLALEQAGHDVLLAETGEQGLELARAEHPDLILLDVQLPGASGLTICRQLKALPATKPIPVVMFTAHVGQVHEEECFNAGAEDFIQKPFSLRTLLARVTIHVNLVSQAVIFDRFGVAAEYRDNETGVHTRRIGLCSELLARAAGWSSVGAARLGIVAPMHDLGKVGIPDGILLKPGKLSPEEWAVMQQHPEIGATIIGPAVGLLRFAREICLGHHEKWDGSGYPRGLAGEAIPVAARIVALVDVYDALRSARPYKEPWPVERVVRHIESESGRHFDPALIQPFLGLVSEFERIRRELPDA